MCRVPQPPLPERPTERISVEQKVLGKNEQLALENRAFFDQRGVVALNFMSAPGAGKTSVLEQTLAGLRAQFRPAVIEGDLYTNLDAERIQATGVPAYQITTGTCCHLDARMVRRALDQFDVAGADVLCIENVGNMVCPAEFDLGEHLRVMVYSCVEGAEKPQKYPLMFHQADCVLLNKIDLLPYAGVPLEDLIRNVRAVNPRAAIFPISCRTGEGLDAWRDWLTAAVRAKREVPACV